MGQTNNTESLGFPYVGNVANFSAQNLKYWRKAKANVKGGAANGRVVVVGDSTTIGINGAGAWITPNITASLSAALLAGGLTATDDCISGFSIQGSTTGSRLGTDPRCSAGSWTSNLVDSTGTLGGAILNSSGVGAAFTFTPVKNTDTVNAIWTAYSNGGAATATVKLGSGSIANMNSGLAGGLTQTSATTTLGANAVTINYASGTGTFYLEGIECFNSAAKSINIFNAGFWGTASNLWTGNANNYDPLPMLGFLAPALTIIVPGINDWGTSVSVATFTANIQTLITKAQLSGDVILCTPTPNNTNQTLQAQMIAALYGSAQTNNCVLIDNWSRWAGLNGYATYNPIGYYSNAIHPANIGYEDQAQAIASVLLSV